MDYNTINEKVRLNVYSLLTPKVISITKIIK